MAEAAVQFLVGSIGSLLEKEITLLGTVRGEIRALKHELESMASFLRDASKCEDRNEGLRVWVAQVRDIAYNAEDIIDEFLYHMDSLRRGRGGLKCVYRRMVSLPRELWVRHQTAVKLQEIKSEIKAIAKRRKNYDLGHVEGPSPNGTPRWVQNVGESSFFIEEDDVVGMDKERDMLLNWLMDGEMQRTVITVVGMGGSGKTTLVAKAYNNHDVRRFFNCQAWVTVSQNYVIEDLFRNLIREFFDEEEELIPSALNTMGYKQLVKTLVEFLQEKRYVVVLDDVWTTNLWRQTCVALPDGRHGSRIILTTRKEDIASYSYEVQSHVIRAQPLRRNDAWTLFCKKAFANEPNKCCPPELEKIARSLVEKCGDLPLAIVALGGLMASKDKSELKWMAVYNSLNWHLSNNPMLEAVKTILFLGYNDLPYYLKYCFLYCCRFPEDQWIGVGRLVRLWMAEGFVQETRGLTLEEVGKSYLKELIARNLLQVTKKNDFLRAKFCKLHDLMRELTLSVSERENFCSIFNPQGMKEGQPRRLSIFKADMKLELSSNMSQVRSFSAVNFDMSSNYPLDALLYSFRLLRVLDLNDALIDNVPTILGKLFNLRYLNLRGTRIKHLPKSLGRLGNLQTLDIRKTQVKALPDGIDNLHNLRHLLAYSGDENDQFDYVIGVQVPSDVWKLKNLQVLRCVEASSDIVSGIGNMTQIKRIELTKVRESDEEALCASIEKLQLLRQLLVMVSNEEEILRMDALSSLPPVLRKLTLIGRLNNVPPWFCSLRNIVHLHLHWSRLTEDPIPHISALPRLQQLALVNAYHGENQLCFNEGFTKLQHLSLIVFPELVGITIMNGVMPSLLCLNLHACAKLKRVPQGIEHLTKLEELDLKDVSEELVESIRGEESVDHQMVKHIPDIYHLQLTASGYKYEKLS